MPNSVAHSNLLKTLCKVLQNIGADTCEEKIELYHHLNKKKQSYNSEISRMKDCEQVVRVKKDFKDLNSTDLGFPERTWLFTNDSLYLCYRGLWNDCKKLWVNKNKMKK